jgi:hypothetical protein
VSAWKRLGALAQTPAGLGLSLAIAIFVVYGQVVGFDYAYYDDASYVFQNPHVIGGLNAENFRWAFSVGYAANWHPVTWLSHMLDVSLFGIPPGGHHLVNVLFHLANSLLLFVLLRRSTGNLLVGAGVAFLFAIHPLRAESVAWIAERKDVLFMFWGVIAMLFYLRWVETRKIGHYVAVLVFMALSLMSKPMLVTLPVLLLLFDYWPLERTSLAWSEFRDEAPRLVLEKIPMLLLSAGSSVMTVIAQDRGGALQSLNALPLDARVTNSIVAYMKYIGMMLWPTGLAFDYPHPVHGTSGLMVFVCFAGLVGVTALVWRFRERHPYFLMGWAWYILTMIPVIGLVQVGYQGMADRYTYFTQIGLCLVLVYLCVLLVESKVLPRIALASMGTGVAIALMLLTSNQVHTWRNLDTIVDHAIAVTEGNAKAHFGKGLAYSLRGENHEALEELEKALQIAPHYQEVRQQIAIVQERIRQQRFLGY